MRTVCQATHEISQWISSYSHQLRCSVMPKDNHFTKSASTVASHVFKMTFSARWLEINSLPAGMECPFKITPVAFPAEHTYIEGKIRGEMSCSRKWGLFFCPLVYLILTLHQGFEASLWMMLPKSVVAFCSASLQSCLTAPRCRLSYSSMRCSFCVPNTSQCIWQNPSYVI